MPTAADLHSVLAGAALTLNSSRCVGVGCSRHHGRPRRGPGLYPASAALVVVAAGSQSARADLQVGWATRATARVYEMKTVTCQPTPRRYRTQRSLPHLARASVSTVLALPMIVPRTSSTEPDAELYLRRMLADICSMLAGAASTSNSSRCIGVG